MESVEDCEKERELLLAFLQSDSHRAYVQDMLEAQTDAENACFGSVPQTLGDVNDREQKMGLRNFAMQNQSWFVDRLAAVDSFIADAKQKDIITP